LKEMTGGRGHRVARQEIEKQKIQRLLWGEVQMTVERGEVGQSWETGGVYG
jgi:hypothetical protein